MLKNYTLGIPILNKPYLLDKLLSSIPDDELPINLIVVDNGQNYIKKCSDKFEEWNDKGVNIEIVFPNYNWGVSKSWNEIIKKYIDKTPIIISNNDMTVVPNSINRFMNYYNEGYELIWINAGYCFFMITKTCIDKIGYFDENFYPAYVEDTDYGRRGLLCDELKKIQINEEGIQHQGVTTIKNHYHKPLGDFVKACMDINHDYWNKKWINSNGKLFDKPFGDKELSYWEIDEVVFENKKKLWDEVIKDKNNIVG
jgi:hypothetical protein